MESLLCFSTRRNDTPDTTRTYWANGLLKSVDNGISRSDYAYNVRNELTSETQTLAGQAAKVVSHSYDDDGLRIQMNSPSGSPMDYTWTARAQLAGVSRDGPPPLAVYTYDKAGRLTHLAHENGITEEKSYNAAGELTANLHKLSGTTVSGHGYGYDTTGRRTSETFPGSTTAARTYGYDTADQIASVDYGGGQTDAYNYDAAGNRATASVASLGGTTLTYTANNANQYTTITGMSAPVHDSNGNLTSQNGVNYTWDSENRLLSVSDGTVTNTFTYDGQHRRVTKRTAVSGTVTEKTHYLYDGWNVIEERTNTDTTAYHDLTTFTLTRRLTWGTDLSGSLQGAGGVGGLLMVEEFSGTTTAHHLQYDGNGNVTEITDSSGAKAATYRYDAFGNTLVATGSYAPTNRYRFSTKPLDTEVAGAPLYYYGYRYYDPVTGRWPSRDPIEEEGGLNLYGFVGNEPISWVDFLGLRQGAQRPSKNRAGQGTSDWGGPATGGGKRGLTDGPKYGWWGGKNWSGGEDGDKDPVDSSDECYKEHDTCYGKCPEITCPSRSAKGKSQATARRKCLKDCDKELKKCLSKLDVDPKKWPRPPKPGNEDAADSFRDAANDFF